MGCRTGEVEEGVLETGADGPDLGRDTGGGGPVCGNGNQETGEECDGSDLGGQTCQGLGFDGGSLACDGSCSFDTSSCTSGGNDPPTTPSNLRRTDERVAQMLDHFTQYIGSSPYQSPAVLCAIAHMQLEAGALGITCAKLGEAEVMADAGIDDIDFIVTASELEVLILESNLIKRHKPKYNVRLKDDKRYPYIKVTWQEDFPRVLVVRRMERDGARYFGPFTAAWAVQQTLHTLRRVFPYLTCNRTITGQDTRACLYFDIGLCLGPCIGAADGETYRAMIDGEPPSSYRTLWNAEAGHDLAEQDLTVAVGEGHGAADDPAADMLHQVHDRQGGDGFAGAGRTAHECMGPVSDEVQCEDPPTRQSAERYCDPRRPGDVQQQTQSSEGRHQAGLRRRGPAAPPPPRVRCRPCPSTPAGPVPRP